MARNTSSPLPRAELSCPSSLSISPLEPPTRARRPRPRGHDRGGGQPAGARASRAGPALRAAMPGASPWTGFEPDAASSRRPAAAEVRRGSLRLDGLRPRLPAIVALWPGPRTYTGQDVAEIHTVGSPAAGRPGAGRLPEPRGPARPARRVHPPGVPLRAARPDPCRGGPGRDRRPQPGPARRRAASSWRAACPGRSHDLRDRLLDLVAHLEANLDFVDEPDVDPLGRAALADELAIVGRRASPHSPIGSAGATGRRATPGSCWSARPTRARAGCSTPWSGTTRRSSRPAPERPATTSTAACDCDGLIDRADRHRRDRAASRPDRDPGPDAPGRPGRPGRPRLVCTRSTH